jgi:hypothetical protein
MTGKLHKNVMRDIRQEIEKIGELDNGLIFELVDYTDAKSEKRMCYEFGKTGALQIALRYDAKTRYKVVKRIEELEQSRLSTSSTITQEVADSFDATMRVANLLGLEGNQAKLSTNIAVKKFHGIDCMATLGITGLIAEDKKQFFTPSVLGKKIGLSAQKFNAALESAGMQEPVRDHKNRLSWSVTDKGKPYCQVIDTNKKHTDGAPIQQVKWCEDVTEFIELKAA